MESCKFVAVIASLIMLIGCGSPPPPAAKVKSVTVDDPASDLASILVELRKPNADASDYRQALDRLNSILPKLPDKLIKAISPEELDKVKKQWGLTDAEAIEINRTEFGPLDAHYLHECVTFRDIARMQDVAKLSAREKTITALMWVVRTVRIHDRPGSPDAPAMVVSRGFGTTLERIYVFSALARQLELDSLLVAGDATADTDPRQLWAAIFMDDRFPRLADPRVGIVLPVVWPHIPCGVGSGNNVELLEKWNTASYDMTWQKIEKSVAFPSFCYLALSPRMSALERLLSASGVRLSVPLVDAPGVATWPVTTIGTPFRALAESLPPEDGGTDRLPQGQRRVDRFRSDLVPWESMPEKLKQVPGPIGLRLQQKFGETTTLTYQPGLARSLKEKQQREELIASTAREVGDAKSREEARKTGLQEFRPRFQEDAGPSIRQMILRGQYEEATTALVFLADTMKLAHDRQEGVLSVNAAYEWAAKVPPVYAEYLRAQRGKDPQAILQAEKALAAIGREGEPALKYTLWLASGHALEDVDYLTALCKLDQAEARGRRDPIGDATKMSGRTAAQAWQLFVMSHPQSNAMGQVLRLMARSQELAGQPAEAATTYKKAADKLTGIEKSACLILADQLKSK